MFVLVSGGSGSGKSEYAERILSQMWDRGVPRYYIATMEAHGSEGEKRVKRHQKLRRGKGFLTVECGRNVSDIAFRQAGDVLLEDLSNLLANEWYGGGMHFGAETFVNRLYDDIMVLAGHAENIVVVTNEIFSDGVEYTESVQEYIRLLGMLNRRLAAYADIVVEVVCAIPLFHKGEMTAVC